MFFCVFGDDQTFKAMEALACLIGSDDKGHLCVMKKAKEILDEITQPVVVVSVVGLYRTGKSYLMNRLAGQQTGKNQHGKEYVITHLAI